MTAKIFVGYHDKDFRNHAKTNYREFQPTRSIEEGRRDSVIGDLTISVGYPVAAKVEKGPRRLQLLFEKTWARRTWSRPVLWSPSSKEVGAEVIGSVADRDPARHDERDGGGGHHGRTGAAPVLLDQ